MPCGECSSLRSHRAVHLALEWGAAISSGEKDSPAQGHQEWWEAGWAEVAWTAGHESLLAGPGSRAEAGARHDLSMKQLGMMVTDCSLEQLMSSVLCTSSWGGLMCHSGDGWAWSSAAGQGPAVCLRPPPSRRGIRDFSKLVITSVFLSWIHLSWLNTVMHRGSNSCPTLHSSTSPLTESLLVSTWHCFFFYSRQKDMSYVHQNPSLPLSQILQLFPHLQSINCNFSLEDQH